MEEKKKRPPQVLVQGQLYPEKPGMLDYVKEAFEPNTTRAQLDAVRKRREKSG